MKHLTITDFKEEMVYLAHVFMSPSITIGSQNGILKVEGEAETVDGRCLLACSSWAAQPAFLVNKGPPLGKSPQTSLQDSLMETTLQLLLPLPMQP